MASLGSAGVVYSTGVWASKRAASSRRGRTTSVRGRQGRQCKEQKRGPAVYAAIQQLDPDLAKDPPSFRCETYLCPLQVLRNPTGSCNLYTDFAQIA